MHHRRDRGRHGRVPHRRPPRLLGGPLPRQQRHRRQTPLRQAHQGQPLARRDPRRMRLGRRPQPRHLPGRPVLAAGPTHRQEEGRRRSRPLHPGDRLAPAGRRLRLCRAWRRLLRPARRRPRPPTGSRPAPSPRLPRHPQAGRRVTPGDSPFRQNPRQRGRPLAQGQPAASPSLPPNLYAGYYSPAARSPVSLRALSLAWLQHKLRLSSGIAHRYFPTKEEVVFWSPYQPMLAGFVAARPDHEPAEQALRHGIADGLAAFYDQDRDRLLERIKLTFRTPALHPRLRQQQADWAVGVAALLADRLDARPDDLEVRAIAAAVAAALFVAIEEWQARDGQGDLGALIDRALGSVLAGPLRATATPKRR